MGAAVIPAVIGLAASVGGSLIQSNAQSAAVDAQNRAQQAAMARQRAATQAEYARQEEMRRQQAGEMQQSLSTQDVDSVTNQLEQVQADRSAQPTQLAADVAAMSPDEVAIAARPGTGGDVQVVNSDLGARLAQAAGKTRGYLQAKSDVGAYDQLFTDRARQLGQTNENINFINKKREGSLRTSGIETGYLGQDFANSISPNKWGTALGSALAGAGPAITKIGQGGYG